MSTARNPLSAAEVTALVDASFPQIHAGGRVIFIETVGERRARVRLKFAERIVRPGGTISGPAMFTLADFSIYVALIATLGATALPAVTTNLNISFLKRPEPRDLVAEAHIIRLGRRLAYAEVTIRSDGAEEVVAHATGSYAIPADATVK
jgi:uncharacterized protein (TIGR00369 family)